MAYSERRKNRIPSLVTASEWLVVWNINRSSGCRQRSNCGGGNIGGGATVTRHAEIKKPAEYWFRQALAGMDIAPAIRSATAGQGILASMMVWRGAERTK